MSSPDSEPSSRRKKASLPRVQFVSKAMVEPFRDGSKCLVRDLCLHLQSVEPHVMGTGQGSAALGARTQSHPVYGQGGGFSPGFRQNLKAAQFMLLRSRAELWHFVFAPNSRSSQVARLLKTLRRKPVVQTIASPPRSFDKPSQLLFGDIVVAQSSWTKNSFEESFDTCGETAPRIVEIPPPAPLVRQPSAHAIAEVRQRVGVADGAPLFLYPGDLEVSSGAKRALALAPELARAHPGAKLVVAYRDKTPRAVEIARTLSGAADPTLVHFERNVPDIHALVAASRALLFPVDDLYGKVDLPIVLLEAFRLGTTVVALNQGPLQSLRGALLLSDSEQEWAEAVRSLCEDESFGARTHHEARLALESTYCPRKIAAQYDSLYRELLGN